MMVYLTKTELVQHENLMPEAARLKLFTLENKRKKQKA
jgi:hypothetical protein